MLHRLLHNDIALRSAQALTVSILAILVALLARTRHVTLLGQTVVALIRGVTQIVIVGLVILLIINRSAFWGIPVLAVMIALAAMIASRRALGIPGALPACLYGITLGSVLVILAMTLTGVIKFTVAELVPIGSMLIANCMNTCAQALERFGSDVSSHVGQIEAALALGAEPDATVADQVNSAIGASMIPRIDNLASLGIVWIPGLMAGMLVQHANPIVAALYNFAVIAMIFASSGLTALASVLIVRSHAFSPAAQLVLRQANGRRKKRSA